jgi:very-short-patch-repair endonuclease
MPARRTILKARTLRRTMTPPELALWSVLRTRPGGSKFRRQHPLGPFVLDFYCATARLAIEVDSLVHEMGDNPDRDRGRDAWLKQQGVDVLRVAARDVLSDVEAVVIAIVQRCAIPLHQPAAGPPPHAARGEDRITDN